MLLQFGRRILEVTVIDELLDVEGISVADISRRGGDDAAFAECASPADVPSGNEPRGWASFPPPSDWVVAAPAAKMLLLESTARSLRVAPNSMLVEVYPPFSPKSVSTLPSGRKRLTTKFPSAVPPTR